MHGRFILSAAMTVKRITAADITRVNTRILEQTLAGCENILKYSDTKRHTVNVGCLTEVSVTVITPSVKYTSSLKRIETFRLKCLTTVVSRPKFLQHRTDNLLDLTVRYRPCARSASPVSSHRSLESVDHTGVYGSKVCFQ